MLRKISLSILPFWQGFGEAHYDSGLQVSWSELYGGWCPGGDCKTSPVARASGCGLKGWLAGVSPKAKIPTGNLYALAAGEGVDECRAERIRLRRARTAGFRICMLSLFLRFEWLLQLYQRRIDARRCDAAVAGKSSGHRQAPRALGCAYPENLRQIAR